MRRLKALFVMVCWPLLLIGCQSLPFTDAKDQIESLVTVYAAGKYTVTFTKDGKVLYTETWECTSSAGKMTGCHKNQPTAPVSSVQ